MGAVIRRLDGDANGLGHRFEELQRQVIERADKPEFENPLHDVARSNRSDDEALWLPSPERRSEGKISVRHVAYDERPVVFDCLAEEAVARREPFGYSVLSGHAIGGEPPKATTILCEERPGLGV